MANEKAQAPKDGNAKVAVPAPAPEPKAPETTLECHAFVRVNGGWQRFEFVIPESVAGKYVTHVSEVHQFRMLQSQLDRVLERQKGRG